MYAGRIRGVPARTPQSSRLAAGFDHVFPAIPLAGVNPVNLGATNSGSNVVNIGENMLVNVAKAARQDALRMRVVVIGLSGDYPPNTDILQRAANVPPYTISTDPVGLVKIAPDETQLMAAFSEVASFISRLGQ